MKLCASSRFPFVCLGDCGKVVTGSTPPKANSEFWGGEIPFVTPAQLGLQSPITAADQYVTREGADRGRLLPEGAVLVCCIGSLGKTGIAGVPLISNQQINAVIFDPTQVDARYGYRAAGCLAPLLEHFAPSTTVKIVKKSAFAEFQIPLPPLAEQKRIARILDAADALRAKRREALAQLDSLIQSTFLDMFGDPVINPMGWMEEHLANLVSKRKHSLKRGPFGGALKKEIFVVEGFKVYEQKNVIYNDFDVGSYFIQNSDYERLIAFRIQPNDLLISCSGTIGRIAAVPANAAPGVMNQALLKITLDESKMLNVFFLSLWRSEPFERHVLGMTHGTGMKNMKSMSELKSINFPVPPLGVQHRFAAIAESVERQKSSQRAHLTELDTLFASLQSRAFRGDL